MSQDIISDTLNQIMNAKKAKKDRVMVKKHSRFLIKILDLMKDLSYLDYKINGQQIEIKIKTLSECRSIKPRFNVSYQEIDRYTRRFLPARNFGYLIMTTSQGLLTSEEAQKRKIGGSLIAYVY